MMQVVEPNKMEETFDSSIQNDNHHVVPPSSIPFSSLSHSNNSKSNTIDPFDSKAPFYSISFARKYQMCLKTLQSLMEETKISRQGLDKVTRQLKFPATPTTTTIKNQIRQEQEPTHNITADKSLMSLMDISSQSRKGLQEVRRQLKIDSAADINNNNEQEPQYQQQPHPVLSYTKIKSERRKPKKCKKLRCVPTKVNRGSMEKNHRIMQNTRESTSHSRSLSLKFYTPEMIFG